MAVKSTDVPAQIVVAEAPRVKAGVTLELTLKGTVLLEGVLLTQEVALLVMLVIVKVFPLSVDCKA